jgi:hypothetical protein
MAVTSADRFTRLASGLPDRDWLLRDLEDREEAGGTGGTRNPEVPVGPEEPRHHETIDRLGPADAAVSSSVSATP